MCKYLVGRRQLSIGKALAIKSDNTQKAAADEEVDRVFFTGRPASVTDCPIVISAVWTIVVVPPKPFLLQNTYISKDRLSIMYYSFKKEYLPLGKNV